MMEKFKERSWSSFLSSFIDGWVRLWYIDFICFWNHCCRTNLMELMLSRLHIFNEESAHMLLVYYLILLNVSWMHEWVSEQLSCAIVSCFVCLAAWKGRSFSSMRIHFIRMLTPVHSTLKIHFYRQAEMCLSICVYLQCANENVFAHIIRDPFYNVLGFGAKSVNQLAGRCGPNGSLMTNKSAFKWMRKRPKFDEHKSQTSMTMANQSNWDSEISDEWSK